MGASVQPQRPGPNPADTWDQKVREGMSAEQATAYVTKLYGPPPQQAPAPKPGLLARTGAAVGEGLSTMVQHPISTAESLVTSPARSAVTMMSPGVGEPRPDPRLSKGGNSSGRPIDLTPYDAEHGAVTPSERTAGGLQTVATLASPLIAGRAAIAARGVGANRVLAQITGLAAAGAPVGAAYNPEDPVVGGLAGALMSTGLGTAGMGAARAVAPLARTAGNLVPRPSTSTALGRVASRVGLSADDAARADILRQIERAGLSLEDVKAAAATAPPAAMLLDVAGSPIVKRASGAATIPSTGAAQLESQLRTRVADQPGRVQDLVSSAVTGQPRENAVLTARTLIADRKAAAEPLYQAAYATDPIDDPDIHGLFKHEQFRDAYSAAQRLAMLKGEKLPSLFNTSELGGEQVHEQIPIPVKTLDWIKRGLDASIESKAGSGNAISRDEARTLRGMLKDALATADAQRPEYGAARAKFAGDSQLMEAHERGTNFLNESGEELAADWPTMTEGERELYRRGALSALGEDLSKVTDGRDVTRKFQNPLMRDKLRTILPDQQAANGFMKQLADETRMHQNAQRILSGSQTAERLAQQADDAGGSMAEAMHATATGNLPGMARSMVGSVFRRGSGLTESRVNALAPLLTSSGPDLAKALDQLGTAGQRRAARAELRRSGLRSAASVAGGVGTRPRP